MTGPRRRTNDHVHEEYWGKQDHYRFEDRVNLELKEIEKAVKDLTFRLTLMIGGLTLIALLLPVIAPFVRLWLNIPQNP